MSGKDGELCLAINGYVVVYADNFAAKLTEYMKEFSFKGQHWHMPDNYTAKLVLRHLSNPDPDIVRKIVLDVNGCKPLDFEFKGYYKSKNGISYPIKFKKLIPVNGDLDNYLSGYIDEWEFSIGFIDEETIEQFKGAY
jgi:hypothetical protein